MDCTHDHQLIANCIGFVDSEAQVSFGKLSLNFFFFLPTFSHFSVSNMKMTMNPLSHYSSPLLLVSTCLRRKPNCPNLPPPSLITTALSMGARVLTSNIWQFSSDTHAPHSEVKERMEKLDMEVDADLVRTKNGEEMKIKRSSIWMRKSVFCMQ